MIETTPHEAELHRLQEMLLSYLIDGVARGHLDGSKASLSQPVLDVIRQAANDAMRSAGDEQRSDLADKAKALKAELVETGGYDVNALALALSDELKPPKSPLFNWSAISAGLTFVVIVLIGVGLWLVNSNAAQAIAQSQAHDAVTAQIGKVCDALGRIDLGSQQIGPAVVPSPAARAEPAPASQRMPSPEKALFALAGGDLTKLCEM